MFTIEHDFDATKIVIIDEDAPSVQEDVTVFADDSGATVEQLDTVTGTVQRVRLSTNQLRDLAAALDLPEGSYRINR